MNKPTLQRTFPAAILGCVILCLSSARLFSAEDDAALAARKVAEALTVDTRLSTNAEAELLLTRQALEQLRRELEYNSTRNAAALTSSLSLVQSTLARWHERQMESVQSSNRTILIISGAFAAVGFACAILVCVVLARAMGRLSDFTAPQRPHQLLEPGQPVATLGPGGVSVSQPGAAEEASQRFQSAIDQLQKRILELEHSAQSGGSGAVSSQADGRLRSMPARAVVETVTTTLDIQPLLPDDEPAPGATLEASQAASRASVLLGKGQALLNMDSVEPALRCFDEVLALEPNNAEALVRKGMALEKLQDWERALESYDRAINADSSMTVAYLYRGGVCNRLQRYREALESYELALQTEKKSQAS